MHALIAAALTGTVVVCLGVLIGIVRQIVLDVEVVGLITIEPEMYRRVQAGEYRIRLDIVEMPPLGSDVSMPPAWLTARAPRGVQ